MTDVRLIAFYLPQYHPIPENDRWWGAGFTEWRNVTRAKPVFPGHYQPRLPGELGFYDLRLAETRTQQAHLARSYGIFGFCYYHYWFGGTRLLERPFQEVLESGEPDFPFCLCWANENWTRRWDGNDQELLIEQTYSDRQAEAFLASLVPAFKDPRYIRIGNKPLLIVYRPDLLPNAKKNTALWRNLARSAGFDDLYLAKAETFTPHGKYINPVEQGFDAALEFPPHCTKASALTELIMPGIDISPGNIFDYQEAAFHSIHRSNPAYKLFRTAMTDWDNTARRQSAPSLFLGSSPSAYSQWLSELVRWTREHRDGDERLVFINAWNEWAEGAHLEPDQRYGRQYLEATLKALNSSDVPAAAVTDFTMRYGSYTLDQSGALLQDSKHLLLSDRICGESSLAINNDETVIAGWALDESAPHCAVQVLVFCNDKLLAMEKAVQYRPELAVTHGMHSIKSGFTVRLTASVLLHAKLEGLAVYVVSPNGAYQKLRLTMLEEDREACFADAQ